MQQTAADQYLLYVKGTEGARLKAEQSSLKRHRRDERDHQELSLVTLLMLPLPLLWLVMAVLGWTHALRLKETLPKKVR